MKRSRFWLMKALCVAAVVLLIPQVAWASSYVAGSLVRVSGTSPFAGSNCGLAGQTGENFLNSEVEPFVDINPANGDNIIGAWQQDRWSNGASRGNAVGASLDNGTSWRIVSRTKNSLCTGGTPANGGGYERASDPWVTISPNGDAYLMSLSVDDAPDTAFGFNPDAMLVSKSTDGGLTWSDPVTLIRDDNLHRLNDKNSMTADPNDSSFVYAVWDRLSAIGPVGRGPTLFTRTTNGGASWEKARVIFDPGFFAQTLGNQIAVRPQGDLINIFTLIRAVPGSGGPELDVSDMRFEDNVNLIRNAHGPGGGPDLNVTVVRSEDKGETWSGPIRLERMVDPGVVDPEDGDPVRTGDIIPDIAVDPNSGQLYAVWQDKRFDDGRHDSVALSTSTDGGLTWSSAEKVNNTPTNIPSGNQQAFNPAVDVAEDGTVSVTYYDFRNNTPNANTLPTDYWMVHCHASQKGDCSQGSRYGAEVRLTNAPFNMERAPEAGGYFVGDYEGLANEVAGEGTDFTPLFSRPQGVDPASIFFRSVGP
ncbi:MAG TPA: sialidase family protein [Rubrobacter sp.]